MAVRQIVLYGVLFFGAWVLTSCGTSQRLAEGEVLYTGAEVAFATPKEIDNRGEVTYQLEELIKPEPNSEVLGMRPKLWVYQKFGRKKPDGVGAKIRDKFGRPPVLLDTARASRNILRMRKYLQDEGYFHSQVRYSVEAHPKKPEASIRYEVNTQGRYTFSEVIYPKPTDPARTILRYEGTHIPTGKQQSNSLIQPGDPYRLIALQAERQRLTQGMRQQGYANFFPPYLYYTLDTLSGSKEVRVRVWVKDPTDSTHHRPYYIRRVLVYPDYTLDDADNLPINSGSVRDGIVMMQPNSKVKPSVLRENILLRAGVRYSQDRHAYTLRHLQDLGTYKFVNIKYRPDPDTIDTDSLVAQIYLTPKPMKELGADVELDTRTGLFSGNGINLSLNYSHQNLFGGAERFNANLNGSAVLQPSDTTSIINTIDLSARVDLFVPRFLTPWRIKHTSRYYLPQTRFSANYSYQQRIGFYTLGSLGGSFGYQWRETAEKQHELTPLSLLAIDLLRSSEDFDSLLLANPFLRSSFSDVLVLGPKYSFTYQQAPRRSKPYHYFKGNIEFSGNILWAGYRTIRGAKDGVYEMFGRPFAQFTRVEVDYRSYLPLAREQKLITRFTGGVGVPYGNSEVLPYLKQFFIGGPVSLRAFGLRSVGPGSYSDDETRQDEIGFVDQTGDLLMEANVEYRFPLVSYLKGALFADVGNIWLLPGTGSSDPTPAELQRREAGEFAVGRFLGQTAVGAGLGLRLDVDFFVLRLDVATPLRRPDRPDGDRWVLDEMRPLSWSWLRDGDNVRLILAIGYPF